MSKSLPKVGVIAEVQNADVYLRTLQSIERATTKTSEMLIKQAEKTATVTTANEKLTKSFNPLENILKRIDNQLGGFGQKVLSVSKSMGGAEQGANAMASGFTLGGGALAMAAAAAVAAGAAFLALGARGASLVGIEQSFERLNQTIGLDFTKTLERLRTASAGTIGDFELMRLTNVALAGATGQVGQAIGNALPRLLEIARVQARATGQDVDFLFQSLITGVKRSSPLLIDNTGLVLRVSEANAAYAESIGKTVEQLTSEERQIALLNATLEAGQTAIDGFAGIQETAAEKVARAGSTITNILDRLAVEVQPIYGRVLDAVNVVLSGIQRILEATAPIRVFLWDILATPIIGWLQDFGTNLTNLANVIAPVIKFFSDLAQVIGGAFSRLVAPISQAFNAIGNTIGNAIKNIFTFLTGVREKDFGMYLDKLPQRLAYGAGQAFAAFANAIIWVANNLIFPAVNFIADTIADFLIGDSPPPKGALSMIDVGGANVMKAWLSGFTGVSLEPVENVAASVNAALGNIGAYTMPQVEARIAQLDHALQPFNDQLAIVKSNFEAIANPAKAALDAIDRQTGKAIEALSRGEAGSAAAVRALDTQRERIETALDMQQELVDQATIQQALAASQQGQERALLTIQKARLAAAEKGLIVTDAAAKSAKEAASAGEKAAGGAGDGLGVGGAMGLPELAAETDAENPLQGSFDAGFNSLVNQGGLKTMQRNATDLQKTLGRFSQANIGQKIADAFSGLGTLIQEKLNEASIVLSDWIGGITDPAREGSIPYAFNALATGDYSALVAGLMLPFQNIGAELETWLYDWFGEDNVNSVLGIMSLLPTRIENTLRELEDKFNESVLVPIQDTITNVGLAVANFFVNTGEGTLSGMLDAGVAWFLALPQRIFDALASLGGIFFAVFVTPMVGGINLAIEAIESFINSALSGLGTLIGSLQGIADAVGLGDQLAEITASLVGGINLPRLAMPQAPAAQMPAAKRGGIFTGGAIRTSELGSEIMMNAASKTAVFPASVTRDIDVIARVLGGGGSMPLPLLAGAGGDTSNNTTFNQNFNLQQPPSVGNTVQQIAMLSSARGRRKI